MRQKQAVFEFFFSVVCENVLFSSLRDRNAWDESCDEFSDECFECTGFTFLLHTTGDVSVLVDICLYAVLERGEHDVQPP